MAQLSVKVVPGASRDGVAGWLGEALKVRVRAPPERGKANAAVEQVLAGVLGLPSGAVRVVAGEHGPRKTVEIDGLDAAQVRARVEGHLDGPPSE